MFGWFEAGLPEAPREGPNGCMSGCAPDVRVPPLVLVLLTEPCPREHADLIGKE